MPIYVTASFKISISARALVQFKNAFKNAFQFKNALPTPLPAHMLESENYILVTFQIEPFDL